MHNERKDQDGLQTVTLDLSEKCFPKPQIYKSTVATLTTDQSVWSPGSKSHYYKWDWNNMPSTITMRSDGTQGDTMKKSDRKN